MSVCSVLKANLNSWMSLGLCRNNYRNGGVSCRNTSFFKPQAASLLLVLRLQPPTQRFELLLSVTKISATEDISILCNHIQHNYKIILNIWPAGIKNLFVLITYPSQRLEKSYTFWKRKYCYLWNSSFSFPCQHQ